MPEGRSQFPGPKSFVSEPEITIKGSFTCDSSGDPVAASHDMPGVSAVTKTATGKYKLALEQSYPGGLKAISAMVQQLKPEVENDSSATAADPHVDLIFTTGSTDTNIVSLRCYVSMTFAIR